MALDLAIGGSAARRVETQTLAPVMLMGPPPPPPIPPTTGMYLPGPPPPGAFLSRPIPVVLPREVIVYMDECRSRSLLKFISDAGIVPSLEDERRRERVVRELGKIVMEWAKRVAYEQGKQHWITSATVLTFGSYALGDPHSGGGAGQGYGPGLHVKKVHSLAIPIAVAGCWPGLLCGSMGEVRVQGLFSSLRG